MNEEVMHSPKRQDLLKLLPEIPKIYAPAPNLIFSVAGLHTQSMDSSQGSSGEMVKYKLKKPKALAMRTRKTPKVTLVLDLDETLVHSEYIQPAYYDYVFQVSLNESLHNIYVSYRPGLKQFLDRITKEFEVVIFTASMKKYAKEVIKSFDPHQKIKYLLYRDYCTEVNGEYVKDLRVLGRDLKNVLIVDNNKGCFMFQQRNGIEISTWINDQNDKELDYIYNLVMSIKDYDDIREGLYYRLNSHYTYI